MFEQQRFFPLPSERVDVSPYGSEGIHLDSSRGTSGGAADKHHAYHKKKGPVPERSEVNGVETGGSKGDRLKKGGQVLTAQPHAVKEGLMLQFIDKKGGNQKQYSRNPEDNLGIDRKQGFSPGKKTVSALRRCL